MKELTDSERLDWLERNRAMAICSDVHLRFQASVSVNGHDVFAHANSLRAAIDGCAEKLAAKQHAEAIETAAAEVIQDTAKS